MRLSKIEKFFQHALSYDRRTQQSAQLGKRRDDFFSTLNPQKLLLSEVVRLRSIAVIHLAFLAQA